MDDDDFAQVREATVDGTMTLVDALEQPEFQEALETWTKATIDFLEVGKRAGVSYSALGGMVVGAIVNMRTDADS